MLLIINILLCKQPIERGQWWHDILGTVIIGEALASDLLIFHAATGNSLNLLFKKQKDRTAPQPSTTDAGFNKFWMRKKGEKFWQPRKMGIDAAAFLHLGESRLHPPQYGGEGQDNFNITNQ